jgi:hypothetical protein
MLIKSRKFRRIEKEFGKILAEINQCDWMKDKKNDMYNSQYLSSGKVFNTQSVFFKYGWRVEASYELQEGVGGEMGCSAYMSVTLKLVRSGRSLLGVYWSEWIGESRTYPFSSSDIPNPQKIEAMFSYAKRVMCLSLIGVVGFDNDDTDGNMAINTNKSIQGLDMDIFSFVTQINTGYKARKISAGEALERCKERRDMSDGDGPLITKTLAQFEVLVDCDGEMSGESVVKALSKHKTESELRGLANSVLDSGLKEGSKNVLISKINSKIARLNKVSVARINQVSNA